ncbi:hypothetical protein QM012_004503 [Aureobasidium pullulans]|uniref:Tethering factor for nuclear proteasome STS1 n=1 Tax=Aureobasidium pullulans TaxID=5580 RepID=A0ABR0TTY4_AURPU
MNSVIASNPLFAPHLLGTPRPSPSRSEGFGSDRMSSRKRKASEDDLDDRMSASPTNSPSVTGRQLFPASRSTKRSRTVVAAGRPLDLPRLLETLSPDEMRNLLQNICDQNPAIAHEVVTKAPRPSIESTLSVLQKYETTFKESFPFGNRPSSDYTYNRVRQPMLQLIEALKDFTPHFLPPNEPQPTLSLQYLDAVTQIIHRLPTWDTFQHNHAKFEAYDELAQAWALAIRESAKRGGGFHLQYAGWDQKLLKHNEDSGGRLQDAVNELRANVTYLNGPTAGGTASSNFDERAAIRQQILSGTYGPDVSVGVGLASSSGFSTIHMSLFLVWEAARSVCSQIADLRHFLINHFPTQFWKVRRANQVFVLHLCSNLFCLCLSLPITSTTGIIAIIPDVPHVVVDIVVDGRPLPEYLDEDDDDAVSPDSITKYVECVSGSSFGIRVDLTGMRPGQLEGGNAVEVLYYLDGQYATGTVHRFPLSRSDAMSTRHAARYRDGGIWQERQFMFADLVTSEDGVFNKPRPELKDLGTITVKLYHVQASKEQIHSRARNSHSDMMTAHENIHEKHLKGQAISTQTKLGEAVSIGNIPTVKTERLGDGDAFAAFNFRYRSRKDLQTLYLIPRSPSPIPLEDRPEEDLNREELLELLRRQKARQEEQIKIKQELKRERSEEDGSDDDMTVTSSRPPAKQLKISTDADTESRNFLLALLSLARNHSPSATISWSDARKLPPSSSFLDNHTRTSSNTLFVFSDLKINTTSLRNLSTMAVLDSLPGVEVTVVVDDKDLHEYQDTDMEDGEDTVTKYVEAVDNANFAIKIKVTADATFLGNCMSFKTLVDGSRAGWPLVDSPRKRKRTRSHTRVVNGMQIGARQLRRLKFNAIETVTEHGFGLTKDLNRVKNLGKIEIRVAHMNKTIEGSRTYGQPGCSDENIISEKAIKGQAVTHSCTLNEEIYQKDKISYWHAECVTGAKNPVAIFVFHYRELMIIPRTPSPVPLEDLPEEDLTPEEMAQLIRQLKVRIANTAAIKRERQDDNGNNLRTGKRARSSTDPVHLELNDDDTFTEVAVALKEKTIIALDD